MSRSAIELSVAIAKVANVAHSQLEIIDHCVNVKAHAQEKCAVQQQRRVKSRRSFKLSHPIDGKRCIHTGHTEIAGNEKAVEHAAVIAGSVASFRH